MGRDCVRQPVPGEEGDLGGPDPPDPHGRGRGAVGGVEGPKPRLREGLQIVETRAADHAKARGHAAASGAVSIKVSRGTASLRAEPTDTDNGRKHYMCDARG